MKINLSCMCMEWDATCLLDTSLNWQRSTSDFVINSAKKYSHLKRKGNRPNVQRLLELYTHTVPIFGHVQFISDMLFEYNHHPLKRDLSNKNNSSAYISAVREVIGRDWFTHEAACTRSLDCEGLIQNNINALSLLRCLLG